MMALQSRLSGGPWNPEPYDHWVAEQFEMCEEADRQREPAARPNARQVVLPHFGGGRPPLAAAGWSMAAARRNAHGEPGSPKAALYVMVRDFVPFATRIYYATVYGTERLEAQIQGRIEPEFPFSYWSATIYADAHVVTDIPGLRQLCNTKVHGNNTEDNIHENGDGKGMDLHRDKHSGFTIVLVFGVLIEGFMQLYPTSGVGVPLACWQWTSSNARDLLHAVSRGRGIRIGLVYTVHTSMHTGISRPQGPRLRGTSE